MPNYSDYQKSISSEIISVKDRLRNFIDDHHWPEDGRYKEVILSDILRKHLPKTVSVGTGFIAAGNRLSTQIDIIIYRNDTPLLFQQSDFVIVAPESVLGVIEAKSNIPNSSMLCDVVNKLSNVRSLVSHEIFTGIFAFEGYDCLRQNPISSTLQQCLRSSNGRVNHMCIGQNTFIKYWPEHSQNQSETTAHYSIYAIRQLAFGYFISNLVEDAYIATTGNQLPHSLRLMFYPIEQTKEHYRKVVVLLPSE